MITIEELIRTAVTNKASDVHISEGCPPAIRLNGEIIPVTDYDMTAKDCEIFVNSVLNQTQKITLDKKGEVDFAYVVNNARIRVNAFRQNGTYALAARLLNEEILSLQDLRLPTELDLLTEKRHGLVLVTGATGSGKSTTLATLVNGINEKYNYHVITIEEPIEYIYPKGKCIIHQREVGSDTLSFANALRASLRQDPDVILLGEMRDMETISTAITASETGHLVFSTLHTIGAANSIDRIVDVFEPYQQQQIRNQLADVLECVVSQQLIPTADGLGRVVATEIMYTNNAVKNHIREGKTFLIPNDIITARKNGMHLMDDSIYDLYMHGYISKESALYYAQDRDAMEKKMF